MASCLRCHFSNDLEGKRTSDLHFLVAAPVMKKGRVQHISLDLSGSLTPLCKALRNFIPFPPTLLASAMKLTVTKLANLDCLDIFPIYWISLSFSFLFFF